jgi:hypothetical protein
VSDLPSGLADDPFDHQVTKSGQVRISRGGRVVVTMAGKQADALVAKLATASPEQTQHLLARATGNYRRGNERGPSRP